MRKLALMLAVLMFFVSVGCSQTGVQEDKEVDVQEDVNLENVLKITRHPSSVDFGRGTLESLPSYDPSSLDLWQVDLRGYDLSSLEIKDRLDDLMYAEFDDRTIWPKDMPDSFDPKEIMELGKSPGLGVEELHKKGITGKGVGIAIIDQALLVDHVEYKDNLKMYEEIHCLDGQAQMHGPAVASIAVGKTVGVAPEADLYYIAETHGSYKSDGFDYDFTWLAKSIDRIMEVNKILPDDKKIRVISISVGWSEEQKGYKEVTEAVDRAKEQGIFVVSSSLLTTYGEMFNGLGRNPLNDPSLSSSYEPGLFWANSFYKNGNEFYSNIEKSFGVRIEEALLVPMDSRTTASPTGSKDYVFYRNGGWSWSIPYIAGLYALTCQIEPDITPDIFWTKALETGDSIKVQNNGKEYELKKIVNPVRLLEAIGQSY